MSCWLIELQVTGHVADPPTAPPARGSRLLVMSDALDSRMIARKRSSRRSFYVRHGATKDSKTTSMDRTKAAQRAKYTHRRQRSDETFTVHASKVFSLLPLSPGNPHTRHHYNFDHVSRHSPPAVRSSTRRKVRWSCDTCRSTSLTVDPDETIMNPLRGSFVDV